MTYWQGVNGDSFSDGLNHIHSFWVKPQFLRNMQNNEAVAVWGLGVNPFDDKAIILAD